MFAFIKKLLSPLPHKKFRSGVPLDSASIAKVEIVKMGDKEVAVRSVPVGEYVELVPRLTNIPIVILNAFTTNHDMAKFLAAGADFAKDELFMILAQASGLDEKYIKDFVPPADIVRFIKTFVKVNEIDFLAGEIQAMVSKLGVALKSPPDAM